jgi:hypothetical protein
MKDTRLLHAAVNIAAVHDTLGGIVDEGVRDRLDAETLAAVMQMLVCSESLLTLIHEAES